MKCHNSLSDDKSFTYIILFLFFWENLVKSNVHIYNHLLTKEYLSTVYVIYNGYNLFSYAYFTKCFLQE